MRLNLATKCEKRLTLLLLLQNTTKVETKNALRYLSMFHSFLSPTKNLLLLLGLFLFFLVWVFFFLFFLLFLFFILFRRIIRHRWWQWCLHRAKLGENVRPPPRFRSFPLNWEIERITTSELFFLRSHRHNLQLIPIATRRRTVNGRESKDTRRRATKRARVGGYLRLRR